MTTAIALIKKVNASDNETVARDPDID